MNLITPDVTKYLNSTHRSNQNRILSFTDDARPLFFPGNSGATNKAINPTSNNKSSL